MIRVHPALLRTLTPRELVRLMAANAGVTSRASDGRDAQ